MNKSLSCLLISATFLCVALSCAVYAVRMRPQPPPDFLDRPEFVVQCDRSVCDVWVTDLSFRLVTKVYTNLSPATANYLADRLNGVIKERNWSLSLNGK